MLIYDVVISLIFWLLLTLLFSGIGRALYLAKVKEESKGVSEKGNE